VDNRLSILGAPPPARVSGALQVELQWVKEMKAGKTLSMKKGKKRTYNTGKSTTLIDFGSVLVFTVVFSLILSLLMILVESDGP